MKKIFSIAAYTFREAVRNKILYSILFFAVMLIMLSVMLGAVSLDEDVRIIRTIGLFSISVFANIVAVFLGVTSVYQELERKTIYNVLSKPVARAVYFFGKFTGMVLVIAAQLALMGLVHAAVLAVKGESPSAIWFYCIWLIGIEALMTTAFALFFSSFSTPYVSGFLALGVWLVGRLVQDLEAFIPHLHGAARSITQVLVTLAPDLSLMTLTTQYQNGFPVSVGYVLTASGYGICYAAFFLIAGAMLFNRRDFI
jgi:ABC-type transport system involved in multi-copper enzyme maturation permease subunit